MKRIFATALLAALWMFPQGFSAAAQEAGPTMTGEEFRTIAEGRTLYFEDETGAHFGAEQYFEGGQSVWLPAGGECLRGLWAEHEDKVCFLYNFGDIACWRLYREGAEGMVAISADENDEGPPTRLRLYAADDRPLICPEGPGV